MRDWVKFVSGNFLTDSLPTADVLIMGHILHDWDLSQKRMLLEKAYAALPKGGALIVYEAIIDDERRQNAFGLLMSLNMLIETTGGSDFNGSRLPGVDARGRVLANARRAAHGSGFHGHRDQIGAGEALTAGAGISSAEARRRHQALV
jgi:hypothetical protein